MQSQEPNIRNADPGLEHPTSAEWMSFLYRELPNRRRRELEAHLAGCRRCADEVATWRATRGALNQWALPAMRSVPSLWLPALKWAAAATLMVGLGFGLGRQTSPASRDLAHLKATVAQLSEQVRQAQPSTRTAEVAAQAARTEAGLLLAEYSRAQAEQRLSDQQTLKASFQGIDQRLTGLRTELETVALNTETGLQQADRGLVRLASYVVPADRNRPLSNPEPQNQ